MSMNVDVFTLRGLLVSFAHGAAHEYPEIARHAFKLADELCRVEDDVVDAAGKALGAVIELSAPIYVATMTGVKP